MNASSLYLVLADSAARAPEAHEQQLLDVDGTVLVQLALFLLTMFLLTKFLWRPYLRVRAERGARVEGYLEEARHLDADAQKRLAKVDVELAQARREGSQERARVRTVAHQREQEIISAAQAAAQETLVEARARVEAALSNERASLLTRASELGRRAAEQVLGRKVA